jgi:type I restriction enzyme S subunit
LLFVLAGQNFFEYLTPIFTGISVPHLSPEQIRSFRFALPPHAEQAAIVEYVNKQTRKLDAAIVAAHRTIALLKEYRTRLIADVVTGQVDVRGAVGRIANPSQERSAHELDSQSGGLASGAART